MTWAQNAGPPPPPPPPAPPQIDPSTTPPSSPDEQAEAASDAADNQPADRAQRASTFLTTPKPIQFRDSGLSLVGVRFGWSGEITAERHTPVWVKLDSASNAVQGFVAIEYQQDASQKARVVAPFSTTPGFGALVELVICAPAQLSQLKLIISDGDARQEVIASSIPAPTELAMPEVALRGLCVLALDSDASPSSACFLGSGLTMNYQGQDGAQSLNAQHNSTFFNALVVGAAPKDLAQTWMAYESIDVLIAREADLANATERAREAIHTWVRSGGHLILQIANAAQTWRTVAPEGVPPQIEFGEREEAPIPRSLRLAIAQSGGVSPYPSDPAGSASSAMMRMALWRDDAGQETVQWSRGWNTRLWGLFGNDGPIASGPVGLGRVTLLGIDPARVSNVISNTASGQAWRAILADVLPESLIRSQAGNSNPYSFVNASGAVSYERSAIQAILDETTMARPVGPWFFVVVAFAVFLLVLFVGPVGRGLLRKRGWLRNSWVVALILTGIASLIGLLAPTLVRSGQTLASTITIHDIICNQAGEPIVHASTTVRSMFSGKPETLNVRVDPQANPEPLPQSQQQASGQPPEGRWWRGMSSASSSDGPVPLGDALTLVLSQPALGVQRAGMAQPIAFGQWTFRAFLEQQAAQFVTPAYSAQSASLPSLRVEIRPANRVRIRGLDASQRVQSVWLFTHTGSARATTQNANARSGTDWAKPDDNGVLEVVVENPSLPRSPRDWLIKSGAPIFVGGMYDEHVPQLGQERLPWFAGMLPGAAQRIDALAAWADQRPATDGSAWGLVVVAVRDVTTVPALQGGVEPAGKSARSDFAFEVFRLIVPIAPDALADIQQLHGAKFQSAPPPADPAPNDPPPPDEDESP